MGVVYLVRHGQASFGSADYDQLSELGVRQSHVVGDELRRRGAGSGEAWCGTFARQRGTAQAAGFSPQHDIRWDEYDVHDVLAGHGIAADGTGADPRSFQRGLDSALARWVEAGASSPCQESWAAFAARTRSALGELVASLGQGEDAVVFTSGGVIGALAALALSGGAEPDWGRVFLPLHRVVCNTGITKLIVGRSGVSMVSFNEHAHLEGESSGLLTYR
ncbi:Phosphoglycerate mutase [Segniliparus rotundus DSM 44985]|uniref:Phosphoglycerate mutase n=1 Tax=Segniliparus rotundus (strain ATCC BAA-972 / CDC 1076 / CIP 108378 / DSM 44985 / JCM 13578) TaxID=640132 RepID=D6ZD02_SEGRD|nr:histidine phosphatase family protein [Segniliparus rotundus]ADG99189.1 Phosphoglycerate mutase [Segniliparus rotundus DSM 44985]